MRSFIYIRLGMTFLVISLLLVPESRVIQAGSLNPYLFKDINTHTSDSSELHGLMEFNGLTYYFADLPGGSGGLWQSDGTPENTRLIKSGVWGGPAYFGASSRWWSVYNGVLYFRGDDGPHGEELWRSDGTADGTYMLLDIAFGLPSSSPCGFIEIDGWLYFTTYNQLWRTDGSQVLRISGANQTVAPLPIVFFKGMLYFSGSDAEGGSELWRYDGISAGPQRLIDLITGPGGSGAYPLLVHNGWLYFTAHDAQDRYALWVTDGTQAGTRLFSNLDPNGGMNPGQLVPFAGGILFFAGDGVHGGEVWYTPGMNAEGQPVAPTLIADFVPGLNSSDPAMIGMFRTSFLFFAKDMTNTYTLWALSDPGAAPEKIKDGLWPALNNPCCKLLEPVMRAYLGKLYFLNKDPASGWELWETDGTPAGTHLSIDSWPGPPSGAPSELALCGSRLCFPADDGDHGRELMSSDGTQQGTRLVYDLNTSRPGSAPKSLVSVGGLLYFLADDGTHGPELWRSDGTLEGTFLVLDIDPTGQCGYAPYDYTPVGGLLYFTACDGHHGTELWATNGQPGGAWRVTDPSTGIGYSQPMSLTPAGQRLFFIAWQNNGYWLWVADPAGNVKPIKELPGEKTAYWTQLAAFGDNLVFFTPDNPDLTAISVWRSDGTTSGTQVIYSGLLAPGKLLPVGKQIFFSGMDLSNRPGLWKTNGTGSGTTRIPIPLGAPAYTGISYLTNVGNQVFFFVSGVGLIDLYRTNAAQDGVVLIKTFSASVWQRSPYMEPIAYAGRLIFRMQKMDYTMITFASDGTPAGTQPIPGEQGFINWLTPGGPFLFFSKSDTDHGNELWRWDGTENELVRVSDINPGPASSNPAALLAWGRRLFFSANDGVNGVELWAYDIPAQQIFLPVLSR